MSSHNYTLPELIDLALKTPGTVNFNTLKLVLLKIVSECKLENVSAEYKPLEVKNLLTSLLEDKQLPDHPILRKTAVEKETDGGQKRVDLSTDSQEKTGTGGKSDSSSTRDGETVETPGTSDAVPAGEQASEFPDRESSLSEIADMSTSSKSMKAGTNLWQLWQIKKMGKKVESLEEELSSLTETVDELVEFKEARSKRILFEEGQKLQSGYSGALIGRQEFEDTVDELGEALARMAMKLKQQQDACMAVSRDILNEMCLKVSTDDLEGSKKDLNRKIRFLYHAVRNIQAVIKESLDPESCAVTKCVACKRKAHLPKRFMKIREKSVNTDYDIASSSDDSARMGAEEAPDLPFTTAALKRYEEEEANMGMQQDSKSSLQKIPVKLERHTDRPDREEYRTGAINVETFDDIKAIARDFEPMKERPIFVPKRRPKQPPATILIENEDAVAKRYTKQ